MAASYLIDHHRVQAADALEGAQGAVQDDSICQPASASLGNTGLDLADLPEHNEQPGRASKGKSSRHTYAIKLAFFGPAFNGWAWAADTAGTVQGAVQTAIAQAYALGPEEQVLGTLIKLDMQRMWSNGIAGWRGQEQG